MLAKIKIKSFTGPGLKTYIPSLAKLRSMILCEYPYLLPTFQEEQTQLLHRFINSKESIGIIVFDGHKIVGSSMGLPLAEDLAEFQKPFLEQSLPVHDYFSFSESVLLHPYRGRGISHHFFDLREEHAFHLKRFKIVCFRAIIRPPDDPLRPENHLSLETFWMKRGYARYPGLQYTQTWQDVGANQPSEKQFEFWTKNFDMISA